jgi:hypothetical protein
MAKYDKLHHTLGRFCSKNNEVLFLKQNRPKIGLILAYFAVTFYALPIGFNPLIQVPNPVQQLQLKYH